MRKRNEKIMLIQTEFVIDKLDRRNFHAEPCVKIHGFLMNILREDIAAKFHEIGEVRPYSLYYIKGDIYDKLCVQTITEEAYQIVEALHSKGYINIYGQKQPIQIYETEIKSVTSLNELKKKPVKDNYSITFLSPTTYKKDNLYMNWYDLGRILSSVAKKVMYYEGMDYDMDLLRNVEMLVKIRSYNLSSSNYKIMKKSIFGFMGNIQIQLKQNKDIEMLNLLLNYANYCGMGAKTALGMGGVLVK